jgi:hypothetical protein
VDEIQTTKMVRRKEMHMFIYDEGWAGGFAVLAKDESEAADIIISQEDFDVENPVEYKKEILKKIKKMPIVGGQSCYHFMGDQ